RPEAIVFYRAALSDDPEENARTHMNLLRQQDGRWKSVCDVTWTTTDIDFVDFGDISGGGSLSIFVVWRTLASEYGYLVVYTLEEEDGQYQLAENQKGDCTALAVGRISNPDRDDYIQFIINLGGGADAILWRQDNNAELIGKITMELDPGIMQFRNMQKLPLANRLEGIYVDCLHADATTTLLLYWSDNGLRSPFYNPVNRDSEIDTRREPPIPTWDIDGDGRLEWPVCTLLPGYDDPDDPDNQTANPAETWRWGTRFYRYDFNTKLPVRTLSCVYNAADGYYLELPDEWLDGIMTVYNERQRRLTLRIWETDGEEDEKGEKAGRMGREILSVEARQPGTEPTRTDSRTEQEMQLLIRGDSYDYYGKCSTSGEYSLTMDKLKRIIKLL
ncbi:MAG: hypothetical protein FWE80_04780, partial [Oscillospiraceae bacterium]|nr:hypothetical protein [Oscillospiraceae bacterium]